MVWLKLLSHELLNFIVLATRRSTFRLSTGKSKLGHKPRAATATGTGAVKEEKTPWSEEIAAIKRLFLQESTLQEHYTSAQKDSALYVSTLVLCLHKGVEVAKGSE
jgi:hypothetical protein